MIVILELNKTKITAMTQTLQTSKLVEIFVACDDFCKKLRAHHIENGLAYEKPTERMSESEIMAIVIFYHLSGMKCFKYYYEQYIQVHLKSYFPDSYAYPYFVAMMSRVNLQLFAMLHICRASFATEANYIDSTKLVVCHNKRIPSHKVFDGLAKRGKSSTGWFFGFKLHAVINHFGQLVLFSITPGNVSDANPDFLGAFTKRLKGFLYGDAGYITSLAKEMKMRGLELITKLRENMKPKELLPEQKYYLQHRGLIESVFNLLKNFCDIEHTRHRSPKNFIINLWSGLIAYTFLDAFPSIPTYVRKMGETCPDLQQEIVLS